MGIGQCYSWLYLRKQVFPTLDIRRLHGKLGTRSGPLQEMNSSPSSKHWSTRSQPGDLSTKAPKDPSFFICKAGFWWLSLKSLSASDWGCVWKDSSLVHVGGLFNVYSPLVPHNSQTLCSSRDVSRVMNPLISAKPPVVLVLWRCTMKHDKLLS